MTGLSGVYGLMGVNSKNVGSKAREGAKAMTLAFVLLDFQHAGDRRRA